MKYVQPFNEWREPAPDTKYVTLYRGDSADIKHFAMSKTDSRAVFGKGFYYTDNPDIAEEYTHKGESAFLFTGSGPTTEEAVEGIIQRESLWRLADADPSTDYTIQWTKAHPKEWEEQVASFRQWLKEQDVVVRSQPDRPGRYSNQKPGVRVEIFRRSDVSKAKVTIVDVPRDWIDRCIDADAPMSEKVEVALTTFVIRLKTSSFVAPEDRDQIAEIDTQLRTNEDPQDDYAEGTTFSDAYLPVALMSPRLTKTDEFQTLLRRTFKEAGFKGIRYDGGKRVNAVQHNAYVFWDEQGLDKFIRRTGRSKYPVVSEA